MSDVLFALFMPIMVLNIVIILMIFIKNFLEKIFSTHQLSRLLKGFIFYIGISLPVIITYIFYRFLHIERISITSEDVSALYFIKDKTVSNSTDLGNNIGFINFLILWFIGILILGVIRIFKENIFLKKLERLSVAIDDDTSIEIKKRIIKELGIRKGVQLFTNSIVPSPFIIGFVKPKVFLPEYKFSELETEFILRHELTHLSSNDFIYRKLIFFLCVMYWFNPVVYMLADKFIEINEMACDEQVLKGYKKKEKIVYMKLLCEMACDKQNTENISNIIYFKGKTEKNFERRLKNMMKTKKEIGKLSYVLVSTLVLGICPVFSYAATSSAINFQSNVVDTLVKNTDIEESYSDEPVELQTFEEEDVTEFMLDEILSIGRNVDIDVNIGGKSRVISNSINLEKGTEVDFALVTDNSNDIFKVGLIDGKNRKTYINSRKGRILHTFMVKKSGEYRLFVEGIDSGKNIYVTGYVYIKN